MGWPPCRAEPVVGLGLAGLTISEDGGTVKASAQTDGYKSEVLTIPENKEFKPSSYTIKTSKINKDFVKFKIDFATETDKSSFRLDNVVLELVKEK